VIPVLCGMMAIMETVTKQQKMDIMLIGKFVEVYCAGKHGSAEKTAFQLPAALGERRLCSECSVLMQYAVTRRLKCPLEAEKPACKHCRVHCYNTADLEKIREIMAYSGKKLILRGRLDYIWHYFF
jgi:hypothetical protein